MKLSCRSVIIAVVLMMFTSSVCMADGISAYSVPPDGAKSYKWIVDSTTTSTTNRGSSYSLFYVGEQQEKTERQIHVVLVSEAVYKWGGLLR